MSKTEALYLSPSFPPSFPSLTPQSESLGPYADYCANLVAAKQTLEAKKQEPPFQDFLQVNQFLTLNLKNWIMILLMLHFQRCLDSDFSFKKDWTLDFPGFPSLQDHEIPHSTQRGQEKGTYFTRSEKGILVVICIKKFIKPSAHKIKSTDHYMIWVCHR